MFLWNSLLGGCGWERSQIQFCGLECDASPLGGSLGVISPLEMDENQMGVLYI